METFQKLFRRLIVCVPGKKFPFPFTDINQRLTHPRHLGTYIAYDGELRSRDGRMNKGSRYLAKVSTADP